LNTLESSKGEESSVSILRNKKLIFGCEHFVPNLDRHEAKQTYGILVEESLCTYGFSPAC
jgi:hypothetical protein